MQKWLLNDNTELIDWKMGDLYEDDVLNAFDLCVMKQELIRNLAKVERKIYISNIEDLFNAVRNALPGDVILVAPGTYDYTKFHQAQKIDIFASGTANSPIKLTASDPQSPPLITGANAENGYVLHITGDYWIIENLCISTSQKGIVLDNSNYTVIRNCNIGNTGSEAIAVRDGSSHCIIKNCTIHDSGLINPGYGEGIYRKFLYYN